MEKDVIKKRNHQGMTLLEIMIALAILAIVILLAIPLFSDLVMKSHLKLASDSIKAFVDRGQSEAYNKHKDIFISFNQDMPKWCFGMDDRMPCNCLIVNDCKVNGRENLLRSSDFDQNLSLSLINYTHIDGRTLQISGIKQYITQTGQIIITSPKDKFLLSVGPYGVKACAYHDQLGYESCIK